MDRWGAESEREEWSVVLWEWTRWEVTSMTWRIQDISNQHKLSRAERQEADEP
jgi:hypothetical protein